MSCDSGRVRPQRDEAVFRMSLMKRGRNIAPAIRPAMNLISEACCTMDARQRGNPEMIHAVAGALKVCAEIWITAKALNVGSGQPTDLGLVG